VTAALPWRGSALPATADSDVLTPFHNPQWGRAWARVRTEEISAHRLLQWPLSDRTHHLPLYLVDSSPLWHALEGDAGLAAAGKVFRGPVTFARTLYGEYGGLPGAPRVVKAEAVDRGLQVAAEWDSTALVVTNLCADDVAQWSAARAPQAAVTLYWAHRVHLPRSADAFVDGAATTRSHKARREIRRQWKRGSEAGLTLTVLHGGGILPLVPILASQAAATSRQHGPALYGPDMLSAAATVPGALALVARRGDQVEGAFVCFQADGVLYLWTAALNLAHRAELHTYAWLMWESLTYAIANGAHTLDAGRGNYPYKHTLGFTTVPLTALFYLTPNADPGLVNRLGVMHDGLRTHAERAWRGHRDRPLK